MAHVRLGVVAVLVVFLACPLFAQNNELGLTLGAENIRDRDTPAGTLTFSRSIVFGANYARRLNEGRLASLYLEFPFAAIPSHKVAPAGPTSVTHLASLYFTPSIRLKLVPVLPISPWVSGGFGYGQYEGSEKLANGAINPQRRRHTGVVQFGGGIDLKTPVSILVPISLRGEFRDFYSIDSLNFGLPVSGKGQHNFVVSGGFVLNF